MHQFLLQVAGLPHKARFSCHHRDALDWGWEKHLQLPKQNVLEQPFKEAVKVKEAGRSPSFCTIHSLEWIISSSNLAMPLNMVPKYVCVSMCVTITEMKRLQGGWLVQRAKINLAVSPKCSYTILLSMVATSSSINRCWRKILLHQVLSANIYIFTCWDRVYMFSEPRPETSKDRNETILN